MLNKYLPQYHFSSRYSLTIDGSPKDVYTKMLQCDFSKSHFIKSLLRLRGISPKFYQIENLTELGFIKLEEKENSEIIFGQVTTSPTFSNCKPVASSSDFIKQSEPNIIKAIINFTVTPTNSQSDVSTETRIWCGSKKMKTQFRLYWFFIKPFSALIRRQLLKEVKRQLEYPRK